MIVLAEILRERMVASSRVNPGSRHGGKLIEHKVNMAGQRAMMDLIRAVIERLKCL